MEVFFNWLLIYIAVGITIILFSLPKSYLIIHKLKKIMATQAEHAQALRDLKAQNEKAMVEILAKIQALEDAIGDSGNTTPEVDEALADLKASVQTDDDIVPDENP